jgi:hypothetical protein
MALAVGLLAVVPILFLAPATKPAGPGHAAEPAPGESPASQAPSAEARPAVNDAASSPGQVLVDPRGPVATVAPESPLSIPDRWGIEITRLSVAAGGKALDLRYKVVDSTKAASMLYLTNFVYIFNHSNSRALVVPFQRENQTSQKLVAGKTYFALLPNSGERVKSGNEVTVVLGGSRTEKFVVN